MRVAFGLAAAGAMIVVGLMMTFLLGSFLQGREHAHALAASLRLEADSGVPSARPAAASTVEDWPTAQRLLHKSAPK